MKGLVTVDARRRGEFEAERRPYSGRSNEGSYDEGRRQHGGDYGRRGYGSG